MYRIYPEIIEETLGAYYFRSRFVEATGFFITISRHRQNFQLLIINN